MPRTPLSLLTATLLLLAISCAPPASELRQSTPVQTPPAPTPPAPAPADPCADLQRHNASIRARLDATPPDRFNTEDEARRIAAHLDRCFPDPHGAWAIRLNDASTGGVAEVRWSLLRLDLQGAILAFEKEDYWDSCCEPTLETRELRTADLDGDGTPELLFTSAWSGPEGGNSTDLFVLTFRQGQLQPFFNTSLSNAALEDRDGDGRLDLVLLHDAETRLDCMGYAWEPIQAPTLIARGLPGGTFSLRDAADLNRPACPELPKDLMTTRKEGKTTVFDENAIAANLLCALALERAPYEQLGPSLDAACATPRFREDCEDMPRDPKECRHTEQLHAWVSRLQAFLPEP